MRRFGVSKEYLDKVKGDNKEEQALMNKKFVTGVRYPRWIQELDEMAENGTFASLSPLPCTALP